MQNFVKNNKVSKVLSIHNASIYQQKKLILSGVNLELAAGEFNYLIGKTGSGKSSLLKTLYAEIPLLEGEASVAGYDLRKIRKSEIPYLRRKLGIVFQDFQLLMDRTVTENLHFVLHATGWKDKKLIAKRALSCLQLVGIDSKSSAYPHTLSGGEMQRVSIARALLNQPQVLLADEPTGNLDPETSMDIMQLLLAVAKEENTAILMATHDLQMVRSFPGKIYQVEDGKVRALN
jgi:cell division transport system ATP-binding protein